LAPAAFANVHGLFYVHVVVNIDSIVNIEDLSGRALEQALSAKLRDLLGGIPWLRHWDVDHCPQAQDAGFDLLATLPLPQGRAILCIVCKKELRPSAFPSLAEKALSPPGRPRIVVAPPGDAIRYAPARRPVPAERLELVRSRGKLPD
jgi:hypothetical protein